MRFETVWAIAKSLLLERRLTSGVGTFSIICRSPASKAATRAALFGDLPIAEMLKRGWIKSETPQDTKSIERELVKFFGVTNSNEIEILPHAAKKTLVNSDPSPSQLAWLYRVRAIAEELMVPKYSQSALESALPKLRALMVAPEEARNIPRILAECGIRLVIVQSLPSAKIDGVCFWLDEFSPVIGLSIRHDRIDNFWFVLRHELEHVRLKHGLATNSMVLDTELEGGKAGQGVDVPEEERAANAAAQEFCVPTAKMDGFVARKAPFFSERDFLAFAKILGVHPGIVAGQLHHKTGRYDRFRQYLTSIREQIGTGVAIDGWGDVYPLG
jgi:HTH-type transcriptional regulator/antitoxin HigA